MTSKTADTIIASIGTQEYQTITSTHCIYTIHDFCTNLQIHQCTRLLKMLILMNICCTSPKIHSHSDKDLKLNLLFVL